MTFTDGITLKTSM